MKASLKKSGALRAITGFIIHLVSWAIVYVLVVYLVAAHSPAKYEYGFVIGWWCVLFADYFADIPPISAGIGVLFFIAFGLLALLQGWVWFHDLPNEFSFAYLIWLLLWGTIFVSPILINIPVRFFIKWVKSLKERQS